MIFGDRITEAFGTFRQDFQEARRRRETPTRILNAYRITGDDMDGVYRKVLSVTPDMVDCPRVSAHMKLQDALDGYRENLISFQGRVQSAIDRSGVTGQFVAVPQVLSSVRVLRSLLP